MTFENRVYVRYLDDTFGKVAFENIKNLSGENFEEDKL